MKIVVGSFQQETNTFSPITPTINDFNIVKGYDMLSNIAVTQTLLDAGVEIIPTLYANAVPSGPLDKISFEQICNELVERIPEDVKIDGVWLYCHGALEVCGIGSGELALLKKIRQKIGFNIPISIALDFHANINGELVDYVNVISGYKTAPHEDIEETQLLAVKLLLQCIIEGLLPKPVFYKVPLLISGDMVITSQEPMCSVMALAKKISEDEKILEVSVFNGHNWVDVPNVGASIVITAKKDREFALMKAKIIAEEYWKVRNEFKFKVDAVEPDVAVEIAMSQKEGPVFISDSGDNTTAGAGGSNTEMLEVLLKNKAKNVIVGSINDKNAVDEFWELDNGSEKEIIIGRSLNKRENYLKLKCKLLNKGNILGWDGFDAGRAIVLRVQEIDVIITENRCSIISPEIFSSVGIDIFSYKIVVVKLGYLYPKLAKVAKKSIIAYTKGDSCVKLETFPFKNINRPIFPLDGNFEWKVL